MVLYILIVFVVVFTFYFFYEMTDKHPKGYRRIPKVHGSYPIVGHATYLASEADKFLQNCQNEYGNIFKFKAFRKNIILIADPDLLPEYFKHKEDQLSLYSFFDVLHFSYAFCDNPNYFATIMALIKKTAKANTKIFDEKINKHAKNFIQSLKREKTVDIRKHVNHYIFSSTMDCFTGIDVPDVFFSLMDDISHLLNKVINMTYPFNTTIINLIWGRSFRAYRDKLKEILIPKIEEFRKSGKEEPSFLYSALEYSNNEIAEAIMSLLFIASENTTPCMVVTLTSLVEHKDLYNQCQKEPIFMESPLVNACIMESARVNCQIITGARIPNKNSTLGKYYVGDADILAISGTIMMRDSERFKDPHLFDPHRFLPPRNEPTTPQYILTWGNKHHHCPGRFFALHEVKLGLQYILHNFNIEIVGKLPKRNHQSTNSFAEREGLRMNFHPID